MVLNKNSLINYDIDFCSFDLEENRASCRKALLFELRWLCIGELFLVLGEDFLAGD